MDFLWPAGRVFEVPLTTVVLGVVMAFTLIAWFADPGRSTWDTTTQAVLIAVLIAWGADVYASVAHQDVVDAAVVVLPIAIVLIALKRPHGPAVTRAMDLLASSTIALVLGVLVAQEIGLLDLAQAGAPTLFDRSEYWLPFADLLRIDVRWIGPFRSPNVTASAAVFIIVYCAARSRSLRVVGVGTGVLTLLLTGTRSSEFAAIAGVLVLVLLTPHERILGLRKRFVGWSAAGLLLVTIGYWVARNPTLSGRVTAWDDFLALWWSEPVDGVGDRGVGLALEQGRITDQLTHAHSIWLDGLARDGLASLVAVVVVVVLALVVTARAARRARPVGLALVVSLLVGGLTETLFDWRYLGYQIAVLLCAVLISAAYTDEEAEGDRLPLLEPPGRVPSTP